MLVSNKDSEEDDGNPNHQPIGQKALRKNKSILILEFRDQSPSGQQETLISTKPFQNYFLKLVNVVITHLLRRRCVDVVLVAAAGDENTTAQVWTKLTWRELYSVNRKTSSLPKRFFNKCFIENYYGTFLLLLTSRFLLFLKGS